MKYGALTFGQVEAIVNKLGGMDGVSRFLAGKAVVRQAFEIWKTINLGTGLKSADDFRKALKEAACLINIWSNDIFGQPAFTTAAEEREIDLIVVSGRDLGFKESANRAQIYDRARELGLELCPAEVGPQLRLQYKDQPSGEELIIAMEPITDSNGELKVFDIGKYARGLWLDGHCDDPDNLWSPMRRWVFCLPRK